MMIIKKQKIIKDLFRAYYNARKNKRGTISQLKFELDYESKLLKLGQELYDGKYEIGKSICFISFKPLKREIFAADFRDRVVHHLIFDYINKIFESSFICDSYSCRIGKGTLYGVKRLDHFIRSCSENYTKECYVLKLDIKGYFMSINKNILFKKIENKILTDKSRHDLDTKWLLSLIHQVVFHDPKVNCTIKGSRVDWVGLPRSKSLFYTKENTGLPIGNLTSQLFGNIYMDDFDHFVKNILKCKYYGRYVDDLVIVDNNKEYLKSIIPIIKKYLNEKLLLEIHPKKVFLSSYKRGVPFLGAFIKPYRIYSQKNTRHNFYKKIEKYNFLKADTEEKFEDNHLTKCIASINSYLGLLSHFSTFNLRKKFVFNNLSVKIRLFFLIEHSLQTVYKKLCKNND